LLRSLATTSIESIETELRRRQFAQARQEQDQSIEASKGRSKSLAGFIREAWHVVEPNTQLIWGWHIDAICQHLEAVTYGTITRLLINIPPGTMKSLIVSVFWPAWEWGPAGLHGMRYFTSSYKEDYVVRDSRKMRDLVASDWYQQRWGDRVALERTGESSFSNSSGGWREGVIFTSMTGGRGDRVVIDDPHSTETAESEADRKKVVRVFRESVTSRLMDPVKSAIIVVMQRLHHEDVSGVILTLGLGYVHLCLPMEFEPDRRCETSLGFRDPRTYDGELLFPERFPPEVIDRDKIAMGSYAWAGQMQQRPTAREGGLFKEAWLKIVSAAMAGTRWVRYWDLAATEDQLGTTAAYTAGVLMGRQPDGKFVIGEVIRMRAEGQGVRRLIRDTAKDIDGPNVDIGFPQDPGQAGKVQAQDMVLMLAGYRARSVRESGDKMTRAEPLAAQAEGGNLLLVRGDWNKDFIEEATNFSPAAKFKDQIDAASGAFGMLLGGTVFTTPETQIAIDQKARVPEFWPRIAAIDISPSTVSLVWLASQPSTNTAYVYKAIAVPRREISYHATAILDQGRWIPLLFDMKAKKRSEAEAFAIVGQLQKFGIEVFDLPLDMEAACMGMSERMQNTQLRVFSNLEDWFGQYRRLARDEKGQIDDAEAGILRATGLALTGLPYAITERRAALDAQGYDPDDPTTGNRSITGY